MLSVCIPVYNIDVRPLARELSLQAQSAGCPVEILIADDGSTAQVRAMNSEIGKLPGVFYQELSENTGRSAIRNYLARWAKFPSLLFLDADSLPGGSTFLEGYLLAMNLGSVVCGGTIYQDTPVAPGCKLRWVYGIHREQLTAEQRRTKGFSITANNFLVQKEILLKHPFREQIRQYGHEDTVFGYDLVKAGETILHTDNPVIHTGLEDAATYLVKTRISLRNLLFITKELITDQDFANHSGILRFRKRLEKAGLRRVTGYLFNLLSRQAEKHLAGENPRLWVFDLYRLGYICTLE
jgi:glycosyltransferase involved in cell wall biosynthesis